MEAGFALEPLAGEPWGGEVAGLGVDPAEGGVGGLPDFHSGGVRREDGAADVVSPHVVDHPALNQGDWVPAGPDVFAEEGGVSTVDR